MRGRRVDANHAELVGWYRNCGATVLDLSAVGKGCPDLLVGMGGVNDLVEIKDGMKRASKRKLNERQQQWHATWRGGRPRIIASEADVIQHCIDLGTAVQVSRGGPA